MVRAHCFTDNFHMHAIPKSSHHTCQLLRPHGCATHWTASCQLPGHLTVSLLQCYVKTCEQANDAALVCHAGWFKADLPFVGEYSTENLGRTPNAVDLK